jgi:predicted PurR-regulated permease PerM
MSSLHTSKEHAGRAKAAEGQTLPGAQPDALPADAIDLSLIDRLGARTTSLLIIAMGVTIFLLHYMSELLAPLAFGLLLFYALDPAVDALERLRVPRWLAAAAVLGLTLVTILGGAYALQDEALTVVNQLPNGARRLTAIAEGRPRPAPGPLEKVEEAARELA